MRNLREDQRGRPPVAGELVRRIEALAAPNVLTATSTEGLTVYRWDLGEHRMHLVYRPSLCVVARGTKVARVGGRAYRYDADHFFFTAVPLPAELEVRREPAPGAPGVLGLVLELDLEQVARVALEIDDASGAAQRAADGPPTGCAVSFTGRLSPALADALQRLVACSSDGVRHKVLHAAFLREVIFELLVGPEGPSLRQAVHKQGSLRALLDVMRYMEANAHETIRMPKLARRAGMSQSSFFTKFREATGTTPLLYLKSLRLTRARALLQLHSASVTEVAHAVGYASSAQFSRDFRRSFGAAPSSLLTSGRGGPGDGIPGKRGRGRQSSSGSDAGGRRCRSRARA